MQCPSVELLAQPAEDREQEAIEFFLGYWKVGEDDWFTWDAPDLCDLIDILEAKGLLTITRRESVHGYDGYGTKATPKGEAFLRCVQPTYERP